MTTEQLKTVAFLLVTNDVELSALEAEFMGSDYNTEQDNDEFFDSDYSGEQFMKFIEEVHNAEEYEDEYSHDYMILTDSEADEKWDESLDNYLDECIYPELPDVAKSYFDDEAWKRDAKHDGRGHSLSTYDGNEIELNMWGTYLYAYRTN